MKRKLTVAMLLSLTTASPLALALGLGEVEVSSTLNAPLRATLPVTDSADLSAQRLNVSVADAEAFAAAGLDRTPLAASVKLDVVRRQGRLVVDLTTERAVREPWIDLMLRLEWPSGQQLHEVTLLLDPPNYDELPALVGASASPSRASGSPGTASAPDSASRPVARAPSGGASDPARVRSGDTLWAVAGRLRPDSGISMNQMMVALVEANPEVFPSGNINAMRAGFTLVVPPREAIAARSEAQADRLVQAMNQAWANRGSGAPAQVALSDGDNAAAASAVASAPAQQGSSAPTDEQAPAETSANAAGEVASDAEAGQRLTLLSDAEVAAEVAVTEEPVGSTAPRSDDAARRQAESASAAPLALTADDPQDGPTIAPDVLAMIAGSGGLSEDQRLLRLEARWRENRQALAAVQRERDALQSELGDLREQMAAMRDQLAALSAGGQGADAPGAGGVVAPDNADDGRGATPWWGALYDGGVDRNLLLGGAGLAALLALWALLRHRRRQPREPTPVFNTAWPTGSTAGDVVVPGEGRSSAPSTPMRAASNEAPSEPARQTAMPEAEAINEADIFMAYGRYDQARELLETGLTREPGRDDLRLKLLRVQLEQGDHVAAARQAEQLRAAGDPDVEAEVAQLMQRFARPGDSGPSSPQRAVFPEADELPPRHFDEVGEAAEMPDEAMTSPQQAAQPPEGGSDALPGAGDAGPSGRGAAEASEPTAAPEQDPLARYRAPAPDAPASPGIPPAAAAAPTYAVSAGEPSSDEPSSEAPSSDEPSSSQPSEERRDVDEPERDASEALPPTPSSSRPADYGREIIDYQPPTLEPSPAPREETPMQPSVEFTPSGHAEDAVPPDAPRPAAGRDLPEDWEVEEVAFPPLSRDNAHFSAAVSATSTLAEARRLLEAGEAGQARGLLENLLEASDDPEAKREARELLDQTSP